MRYIYIFLLFITGATLFCGCKKNEFVLEFDLEDKVTDNYSVTYYATDHKGGITIQAVASLRNGKGELKGGTKLPTLVYVTARRSIVPLVFVAQRDEKILITGEGNDPLSWNVEGDKVNEDLSEWRKANLEYLTKNIPDSINLAVKEFVEENTLNPASTILLLNYYDRRIDEKEYNRLMASLQGEAHSEEWLRINARSDQLYHSYSYPARLESLVMRGSGKTEDTIMADHKNPILLVFWQTGISERKEIRDSLKNLEKNIKDSVLLVGDICLDIDSVAWKGAIRRDSLEKVKHLWVALGMLDSRIEKLNVPRLPYYIVFDKEGTQSYRGTSLTSSLEEFRRLRYLPDSI